MNIMICGSMSFAKEMLELQSKLRELGYTVNVPCDTDLHAKQPGFIDALDEDREHLIENDIMRKCFDLIVQSDAVVFLNLPKNGVDGYIGTSSLMEMGLAYYMKKQIYLMHPHPDPDIHRWAHEVASFQPTILDGNISLITCETHENVEV